MSAWASARPLTRKERRALARAEAAAAARRLREEAYAAALAALKDPTDWLAAAPTPIARMERAIVLRNFGRLTRETVDELAARAGVTDWPAYARSWWEASRWRGGRGLAPEDVADEAEALGLIL